jgi:hypothetical protein
MIIGSKALPLGQILHLDLLLEMDYLVRNSFSREQLFN